MNQGSKILYWSITGGLLGFGLVGIMTIGLPFLVLGAIMLVLGILKVGAQGSWAAVVGFGTVPALVFPANLAFAFLVADPSCSGVSWGAEASVSGDSVTLAPGEESTVCSVVPASYLIMLVIFAIIALSGIGWRIFRVRSG